MLGESYNIVLEIQLYMRVCVTEAQNSKVKSRIYIMIHNHEAGGNSPSRYKEKPRMRR
jgi:hypothetical protein